MLKIPYLSVIFFITIDTNVIILQSVKPNLVEIEDIQEY